MCEYVSLVCQQVSFVCEKDCFVCYVYQLSHLYIITTVYLHSICEHIHLSFYNIIIHFCTFMEFSREGTHALFIFRFVGTHMCTRNYVRWHAHVHTKLRRLVRSCAHVTTFVGTCACRQVRAMGCVTAPPWSTRAVRNKCCATACKRILRSWPSRATTLQ